jgi:hypothetical protein
MNEINVQRFDLRRLRLQPLSARRSLTRCDDILIPLASEPPTLDAPLRSQVETAARSIRAARARGASVMLIYGAHLLRNGAALLLDSLMADGWLTHLATNGAGTIHDWEYAWMGKSTEGVEENVSAGTFGCWQETSFYIHAALMVGALDGLGYGMALGRFIAEDGCELPSPEAIRALLVNEPEHPLTAARADLFHFMRANSLKAGRLEVVHHWKHASILASAWKRGVPTTVHPGIGYDIISNHHVFNGAVLGRGAAWDFELFCSAVAQLEGGTVLSVGSAIMGPQVFEKSLSCVNNLRLQEGEGTVSGHSIFVVDLQDGGGWDWTTGEPPKTNPAYYLRFCKSYSRMGGLMRYLQCDNAAFVQQLWQHLSKPELANSAASL